MEPKEIETKKEDQTFYNRYYFQIWLFTGISLFLFRVVVIEGNSITPDHLITAIPALIIAGPFLGVLAWSFFHLFLFVLGMFIDGIEDKDPMSLLGGFWLLLGFIVYFF